MGILTKIFVVLVAVLSVALAAFTATYVKNNATVKGERDTLKGQVVQAQSAAEAAQQAKDRQEQKHTQTIGELDTTINDQRGEIASLNSDIEGLKGEKVLLENRVASLEAQREQVSAGTEQQATIIATLRDELKDARTKQLKAERSVTELTDALQTKSTELDTAVENIRLLKENVADLQNQLEQSRSQVATVADTSPSEIVVPSGTTLVKGLITAVKPVGEDLFVSVNVGSNDDVKPGMEFMIHDENYVGSLVISKVDLNSSAGRVTLKVDEITAGLEITASF